MPVTWPALNVGRDTVTAKVTTPAGVTRDTFAADASKTRYWIRPAQRARPRFRTQPRTSTWASA
jgi:hypothetical protein